MRQTESSNETVICGFEPKILLENSIENSIIIDQKYKLNTIEIVTARSVLIQECLWKSAYPSLLITMGKSADEGC